MDHKFKVDTKRIDKRDAKKNQRNPVYTNKHIRMKEALLAKGSK